MHYKTKSIIYITALIILLSNNKKKDIFEKKRLSENKSKVFFVYPGDINAKTGGYIYEKNILEYAKLNNINIKTIVLSQNYPFPSKADINYFLNILDKISPNSKIIIDGLALEGMYSIFNKLLTYDIIALIHHPLYLEFNGKISKNFLKLEKENFNKINKFIVTSKNTKSLLIEKFKIKNYKIFVVEPGIERLKKYNFKKNNKIHFLTCGSIINRKNYLFLLKVLKNFDNIILDIVGDTTRDVSYFNNLKNFVINNSMEKKIIFHGLVSEKKLAKLYSKSDCYISVSKYEGFGMSLANALIIKKPIVTYFTKTILNTLGKKGVVYFQKFDVIELRNIIRSKILNKNNFKKLNIDINRNKRYLLTPQESAKKFINLI
jgi:glycosyltransferase involved in cell wall biosynthesis